MKNFIQRLKPRREKAFPHVETYLQTSLKPVKPRQDFVNGLRGRLMNAPRLYPRRHAGWHLLPWVSQV